MKREILRIEHVYKRKGALQILEDFRLNVFEGELVCLIGLSGSGKSTLANILSGNEVADQGLYYNQQERYALSKKFPNKKMKVYGLFSSSVLAGQLSVAENIFVIGSSNIHKLFINKHAINHQTTYLMKELSVSIPPDTLAVSLTRAQKHIVEILRAMMLDVKLIVMDSVDDGYTLEEKKKLIEIIGILKSKNISVLYFTRNADEIASLSERLFVIRKGKNVKTIYKNQFDQNYISSLLMEREFIKDTIRTSSNTNIPVLTAKHLWTTQYVKNLDFTIHKGEIVGLVDYSGKVNNSIVQILTGESSAYEGVIFLDQQAFSPKNMHQAIAQGLGFIPQGSAERLLAHNRGYLDNLSLGILKKTSKPFFRVNKKIVQYVSNEYESEIGASYIESAETIDGLDIYAKYKLLLYRWLLNKPKVLVYVNPCAYVDIVMKEIIYGILDQAAKEGMGILILSSDLSEVVPICDRIIDVNQK